jgi:hypothetical protein
LKPERWGSPLIQDEKYQGGKVCDKRQQMYNNNNNNNNGDNNNNNNNNINKGWPFLWLYFRYNKI